MVSRDTNNKKYRTFGRNCDSVVEGGKKLSGLLINTIRKLPVTLENIRKTAGTDIFIQQIKKQVRLNEETKREQVSPFSICDQTLMYADRVVMPYSLQKKF